MKLATITVTTAEVELPEKCPECGECLLRHHRHGPSVRVSLLSDVERVGAIDQNGGVIYIDAGDPDTDGGMTDAPYMVQCQACGHVLAGDIPQVDCG
jgi:ribosomal protein L32